MDDKFLLCEKPEYLQQLLSYMNKKHPDIKFSLETVKNKVLPFLDICYLLLIAKLLLLFTGKKFLIGCT